MKTATKIPVHYYTELTEESFVTADWSGDRFITNENGKQYLVEVL